ncbi:HDOD domain-containing protein [Maridesulfovibrio ferrireducens]|uniref:HDOD domain-containing protein n=1 Tax=Maridesulfovibrio ferrireducens TaxID=246191 RepID=UPI001A1F3337|nr:HDOD domain-containing protein [Maridesulfovibrio ferrireducens]MBI9112632.1 HDOD domain-containing protein [Maridesulfovibrio ferrireducens]
MKLKILFVDDDEDILASFKAMLHSKRKEWKCQFVSCAKEGLKLIEQEPFDVVLSDMRMPCMDGADFLKIVEKLQPGAVRIIFSGYSESQALLKSVKNAHQFLSKPCSSEAVLGVIQRVTELRHILTDDSIRTLVTCLDTLPAMPELLVKITHELESPEPDLKRVADFVQKDVGVSATLMKLVNSSFFGFYGVISSPHHAVTLLGVEALKGLVLGVQLFKKLETECLGDYSVEKLWDHCLQTGYFAK